VLACEPGVGRYFSFQPGRPLRMPSPPLIASAVLLVVCGPFLLFPDMLPVGWRTSVVTLITVTAFALGVFLVQPWKKLRPGLWLFVAAVVASWIATPGHDLVGLRHFSGIGFGILAMAVVASWCITTDRLVIMAILFALAATGVLILGLLSTSIHLAEKFVVIAPLAPALFSWLPEFKLGLPGLDVSETVNANALGGTALLVLPACGGLAAAALVGQGRRRSALLAGAASTVVGIAVLGLTLSRTAWLAAMLTLVLLASRWRRGRSVILLALLIVIVGLAFGAKGWQATSPESFNEGAGLARRAALERVAIWRDGLRRLREAPWLGVGINQFHEPGPTVDVHGRRIPDAHAHNMLLQVALDIGVPGLCAYLILLCALLLMADQAARRPDMAGRIAGGSGLSLVAVHLFGLGDAIALGAKVGLFQWLCTGMILAAWRLHRPPPVPSE